MLFNSSDFARFFAIVYALYLACQWLPRGFRWQNAMLLVAGYVFYGWWDVRFLYLIAFSSAVDSNIGLMLATGAVPRRQRVISSTFLVAAAALCLCVRWSSPMSVAPTRLGLAALVGTVALVAIANASYSTVARMDEPARRNLLVFLTVFVNLTFLACFKYFNFFVDSADAALAAMGLHPPAWHLNVVLPVGTSFYTFQSFSYTIDCYRGTVRPAERFRDFALYVAFFPPMVAGPIERGAHLLPQLPVAARAPPRRDPSGHLAHRLGPLQEGGDRRQPRRASPPASSAPTRSATTAASTSCSASSRSRSRSTATSAATPTSPAASAS